MNIDKYILSNKNLGYWLIYTLSNEHWYSQYLYSNSYINILMINILI